MRKTPPLTRPLSPMANIPVERTGSSFPWWLVLLGLVALGAIVWFATRSTTDDTDRTAVTQTTDDAIVSDPGFISDEGRTTTTAPGATNGVMTNPARLVDVPATRDPAGREVRFDNMRVEVAYSDSVFYATHADGPPGTRFFVVLGNPAPSPSPFTPPATLDIGEVVTIEGVVREPSRDDLQRWDIAPAERDRLMRLEDYYVAARRVDQ